MVLDVEKARARLAALQVEANAHHRTADLLRDLADDEEREAVRIEKQAENVHALIVRERPRESGQVVES